MSRLAYARTLLLIVIPVAPSHGQPAPLQADELLLLYNASSKDSAALASHYAEARDIPDEHRIGLDLPTTDEVRREVFDARVVAELRRRMKSDGLDERIRCVVTFFGVPIRVGPVPDTPELKTRSKALTDTYASVLAEVDTAIKALNRIAASGTSQAVDPIGRRDAPVHVAVRRYTQARIAAYERLAKLTDADAARRGQEAMFSVVTTAEGAVAIVQRLTVPPDATDSARRAADQQRDAIRARLDAGQRQARKLLSAGIDAPERAEARQIIRQHSGLLGLLDHLQTDLNRVNANQTTASFDSELSLLWWDDDYPRYRWLPNRLKLLHGPVPEAVDQPGGPVLMVSRLDGPSPKVVRRIIDESIAVERRGLRGKVYIDARGLTGMDAYGTYDRKLHDLADLLKRKTKLTVKLDNRGPVFKPGTCRDVALYCGWYSLGNYVDAFDFVPGAVGLHIASHEAITLQRPAARYWCKELLDDGVAATYGPVAEPYLHAFADPREFFGLILTGRFSLVEAYYFTKPFNSWMMLLVADPLYRPFAANPHLKLDDVIGENVSWPAGPTTRRSPQQ